MSNVRIEKLDAAGLDGMTPALEAAGLPTSDIRQEGRAFFRFDDEKLAGYGGIEGEGSDRLLRSLVVVPHRKGTGVGRAMLAVLEHHAAEQGVVRLHLLTNTAAAFFRAAGYADAVRADAPAVIASCEQFRSLCPASAAYLVKEVSP